MKSSRVTNICGLLAPRQRLLLPRRMLAALLLAGMLAGCSSFQGRGSETPSGSQVPESKEYLVQRGETLYSIGAQLKVDPMDLARWNSINSPYLIRPGQKLKVQSSGGASPAASGDAAAASAPPSASWSSKTFGGMFDWFGGSSSPSNTSRNSNDPFAEVRPGEVRTSSVAPRSAPSVESYSSAPGRAPAAESGNAWQWPVVGASRVHRSEDGQVQGLRIRAGVGQPVYAARDGKVTFVNSFPGYGELLVIEHDGEYLSAYGFIRKPKVAQDQTVRKGAVVAEVGEGSDGELHFEIRRDGKPLDPSTLLPRNQ